MNRGLARGIFDGVGNQVIENLQGRVVICTAPTSAGGLEFELDLLALGRGVVVVDALLNERAKMPFAWRMGGAACLPCAIPYGSARANS